MKTWTLLALIIPLTACGNLNLTAEPERETRPAYDLSDSDWDGVITARDNCLDSPMKSSVDNDGCHLGDTQILQHDLTILFAHDKSVITPQYQSEIDQMAAFMEDNPNLRLLLEGHASQVGPRDYNVALSKRRAETVRQALIQSGVSGERLEIIGYGDTRPMLMGNDEQSHAANRRVVGALTSSRGAVRMRWDVYSVEH